MPARLDIDGTPEQPPRKRGRSPKISPDIDEKELDELGLSSPEERVAAQLRSMVSSIEELRISMTSFENDVFQRLDDNSKAAALMREGGAQDTAKNLVKLEATMAELHETVTVMITRYDTSTAMLAACDRITRARYEKMTREVNRVIARHLKEELKETPSRPMPLWQLCALWLLAPLVLFLALFGLWQLLG